jgi:HYDIN/CFA65/VesB family protein
VVEFNPTSLSFGSVKIGQTSSLTTALTNLGSTMLSITTVSITGADSGDFSQVNTCVESFQSRKR